MNIEKLLKQYVFWPEINNDFHKNINFSQTPIAKVADEIFDASNIYAKVHLENYIFKFYAYNEYINNLRNSSHGFIEEKDTAIFNNYKVFLDDFSKKIFSYILYCCLAEARHSNYLNQENDEDVYFEKIQNAYVKELLSLYKMKSTSTKLTKNAHYTSYKENYSVAERKDYSFKAFLEDEVSWINDIPDSFVDSYEKSHSSENTAYLKTITSHYSHKTYMNGFKKTFPQFNIKDFTIFCKTMIEVDNIASNDSLDGDSGEIQKALMKRKIIQEQEAGKLSTERFLESLTVFFKKGFRGGYGGQPWSDIAHHALKFAKGEINAEMFLDRSLSLEHNGGNMFNKDYIFSDHISHIYFYTMNKKGETSHLQMGTAKLLLNLQNSSSVLAFSNLPHIKKLSMPESKSEIMAYAKNHSILNNQKISEDNLEKFANVVQNQNKHIYSLLEPLYQNNADFIASLNVKPYDHAPFDLQGFVLSYYKSQANDYNDLKENKILESHYIHSLNSDLFNHPHDVFLPSKKLKVNKDKTSIFKFHDLNQKKSLTLKKEQIGGKAKGIVELMHYGFNVPKGLVFDTSTCLSYIDNKPYFNKEFKANTSTFKNYLLDEDGTPILVSVRSGAPVSMPGMMDSILNVGIDDKTYPLLVKKYDKEMIDDCVLSFITQFCASKFNLHVKFPKTLNNALDKFAVILIKNDVDCNRKNTFPLNVEQQIKLSVEAVFDSWNSPRAIAWRNEKNIAHTMGTAATIQKMVFGNKNEDSLTCVIFSRDCITGKPEIMGEYLLQAQGDDLVSGRQTPINIQELKKTHPQMYKEIEYIAKTLEEEHKAIQDIEITVEDNQVYVLQKRNAVVSSKAQIVLAKEMNLNLIDHVTIENVTSTSKVKTIALPTYKGLSANPGIISGIVVKSQADIDKFKHLNKPFVFLSDQALPEHAPIMIATDAFITQSGGATSHAAILARSMNKPCVVGLGKVALTSGKMITIDAYHGHIWNEEQPIVQEKKEAEALSLEILKEQKIVFNTNKLPEFLQLNLKAWYSDFAHSKTVSKSNKFNQFLSIAQKTASVLLKEEDKKRNKIKH